jgi:hypothetical protein
LDAAGLVSTSLVAGNWVATAQIADDLIAGLASPVDG